MTTSLGRKMLVSVFGIFLLTAPMVGPVWAKDALTIDLVNEPSSLDPHVQWNPDSYYVYRNIFDNLVTRDDKGTIIPQVATEWKYLSDTEIEFKIRSDITFHDGSKLTADDVAFSVKRITDPKFGSPQLGQFNKILNAKANGQDTVILTTDGPYPALLAQLVKLSIVPKAIVERVGKDAFNLQPIGSGPYKFEAWQRGVSVTLARNESYWGEKGKFEKATFRAVPDASTRLANLQAGTSDLGVTLDGDLAAQLEGSASAKTLSALTERVAYLRLNTQKPPFNNAKLRQAVAHAIDKEGLIEGILGGHDKAVDELATPVHFGWVDGIKGPAFDPDQAKKIVSDAGESAKAKINFATAPVFDQRVVQAIQQMLTDVGFNVEIEMTDMATYLKRSQGGPETASLLGYGRWSCACQDVDGVLFPLLDSKNIWSTYRNPEVDKQLADARSTLDEGKRLENYKKVHETVASDIPVIPLYQVAAIYGASKHLAWTPTPNESLFLNRMTWSD
ncbi:peptide ABC transporter [Agrobacterium rubi]|uniref:ABC transporter substrate-binding protein n=1 Tax=Agrobacterium rubi TaxID=28099 RepID=UPI00201B74BB|nr:ABC transporter substrate-binding protein [Agrobacterium rubi]MCL6654881.1 peptide ABC transporter [Agrobacterium rubi]